MFFNKSPYIPVPSIYSVHVGIFVLRRTPLYHGPGAFNPPTSYIGPLLAVPASTGPAVPPVVRMDEIVGRTLFRRGLLPGPRIVPNALTKTVGSAQNLRLRDYFGPIRGRKPDPVRHPLRNREHGRIDRLANPFDFCTYTRA